MDEWDEFLERSTTEVDANIVVNEDTEAVKIISPTQDEPRDLGDFGDNAEVLMQMARGESLNSLSSSGVWINSTPITISTSVDSRQMTNFPKKRSHNPNTTHLSVPVANSIQDLIRSLTGHPILSHPLSQLKQQHNQQHHHYQQTCYEIDSLGLFFYGTAGDVKVDCNVRDDMMKVIEMKRNLLGKSIINFNNDTYIKNTNDISTYDSASIKMIISHKNLSLLASSIPPDGKCGWVIPFSVDETGKIDLSSPESLQKWDTLALFDELCSNSVESQISGLIESSEHLISFNEDELPILVQTRSPPFNISIKFRGSSHQINSNDSTNFLFYRQSNYLVEVDFESLKIESIKSLVPRFDQQNRLFLLLKSLRSKLSKLPQGKYFLAHPSNTPFIKILSLTPQENNSQEVNIFETFLKHF